MRAAPVLLAAALLLAGCSGDRPAPAPEGPTDRTSDDRDDPAGDWVGTGCDQLDAGVWVPTQLVRPLVPERFPVAEVLPGLALVFVSLSHCDTLTIDGNLTVPDARQARLQVFSASTTLYVVEWVVPEAALRQALLERGLDVKAGSIEASQAGGVATQLEGTHRILVDGQERATIIWRANDSPFPASSTYVLLQDVGGQDRQATFWMDTGPSASPPQDHCIVQSTDATWSAAIVASPQVECFLQNAWDTATTLSF